MQVIYQRCCGIDVHKKMIVACLLICTAQGMQKEIQTFSTMLQDLYRLRDWLKAQRCEAVAMESTGVYWKCIWNVLEGELELLLCNAQHIKAVPGRKTDIKDAEWIADLLQHGRLASQLCACPSPTGTARFDRAFAAVWRPIEPGWRVASRRHSKTPISNWLPLPLISLVNPVEPSKTAMLAGEQNPQKLAELAQGRMKEKREQLAQASLRTLGDHHRFLLESQLRQLDFFTFQIRELDQEIAHGLGVPSGPDDPDGPDLSSDPPAKEEATETPVPAEPAESILPLSAQPGALKPLSSAEAIRILDEVSGINVRIGEIVVAELGLQMDRFPDEAHLCSWVGLCPEASISANKRLSTKTGKGNRGPRQALIEEALAAARSKGTFLGAYYQRLHKRMGHKKAIVALAHRILVIIYHLLKEQQSYRELGPAHVDQKAAEVAKRRALRTLEQLGYDITLQSAEVA